MSSILPILLELTNHPIKLCCYNPDEPAWSRFRRQKNWSSLPRSVCKRRFGLKPRHHHNGCTRMANLNTNIEKDTFEVMLDTRDFSPEEITIKTKDNQIIVEAKHDEKKDEHGFIKRHFIRKYTLPKDILKDVIATFSTDGFLTIKAQPKPKPKSKSKERVIPIQQTGEFYITGKGEKQESSEEKMAE